MTARRAAWLSLALALGLAVLLVLATPVGPWLLGRGLVWLAPHWGWQLQLGQTSGALAGEFSFVDLRASSSGDSLRFTLERGTFSPWQYALTLKDPALRLRLGPAASTPADTTTLRLSVSSFPRFDITGGTFQLDQPADSLAILVEELEAHYGATGDTTGNLQLRLPRWRVAVGGQPPVAGGLQAELNIEPARLELVDLQTQVQSGPVQANAQGRGSLGLGRALPAALQLETRLETDSLRVQLGLNLEGALSPMDTRLTLLGQLESSPWGPLSLRARARLDSARVTIDSLHLEAGGGVADGQLSYALAGDSLSLQLQLDHLDLSRLSSFKGQVDAQLEARGNPQTARYAVQLELAAHQLDALSGAPLDARLRARLQPDQALDATLDSRLGQVQVAGTLAFSGQYDLGLTGALDPSTLLGYAAAPVQLQGRARPDSLALQLDSPSLPLRNLHLGPAHAELALAGGRQLQVLLALAGTQLQARLRADLQENRIDTFTAEVAALPLAQLDSSLAGTLRGQLRASGGLSLAALRVDSQLQLQGAGYDGWQAGDLELGLEYTAQQARALLSGQGLQAACTLKGGDLLDARLEFGRATFRRGATDSLVLSGSAQVAGPLSRPEQLVATGLLSHLALRQADWGIRNADTLRFAYADTRLRCEPFTLETPAGRLQLAGSAGQDRLDLQGHIEALEIANWAAAATGTGKLDFALSGTAAKPQVQAQLSLDQLQLNGHLLGTVQAHLSLADTLTLAADLEQGNDPEREFSFELAAPTAPLLAAAYTDDAQLHLRLHARQADLRAALSLLAADSLGGQLSLDGDLQLPLSLLADPRHWHHLTGQVQFDQLQLDKPGLRLHLPASAPATIALDEDHLKIEGFTLLFERLDPARNELIEDGTLSLKGLFSPTIASQLQLDLTGIDLRTLDTWNQQDSGLPAGKASLQARFAGTLADPDLGAELEITTEDLGRIESRFRGDALQGDLKLEWLSLSGDSLQVDAQLPWNLDGGLAHWDRGHLQARSSGFSLLPLLDQLPQFERFDGTLSMDLAVDGFAKNMQISGWAEVEDLELRLLDVKPSYFFPSGRLEFSGQRGELRNFVGHPLKGEGRAELSGYVDLASLDSLAYDLRLQTEDLPLNYDDLFVAPGINLDASLSSTPTGSLLRCPVLRIYKAQAEVPLIDLNAPPVPPPPATVRNPFFENMQLDLAFDLRDLQVENEVLQLRMEGFSRIYGTFYKPQFQGSLEIPEGKVFVLNSEFTFNKGRISLDRPVPWSIFDLAYDPRLLNPDLDIELGAAIHLSGNDAAELGTEDCQVTLKLQGPTIGVVPDFTSEPSIPQLQIYSLLAFGTTQMSSQPGAEYAKTLYATVSQLLLSRQVKRIGLDQFQILPSGTLLETVGEPSLRLGKYFKFPLPLQVNYEAATANPSEGEFRTEYKVGTYMTLTGAAQSKYQRYGLGFGLKKDF